MSSLTVRIYNRIHKPKYLTCNFLQVSDKGVSYFNTFNEKPLVSSDDNWFSRCTSSPSKPDTIIGMNIVELQFIHLALS